MLVTARPDTVVLMFLLSVPLFRYRLGGLVLNCQSNMLSFHVLEINAVTTAATAAQRYLFR